MNYREVVIGHSPPTRICRTRISAGLDKLVQVTCKRLVSSNALQNGAGCFFKVVHRRLDKGKSSVRGFLGVSVLVE